MLLYFNLEKNYLLSCPVHVSIVGIQVGVKLNAGKTQTAVELGQFFCMYSLLLVSNYLRNIFVIRLPVLIASNVIS